MQASSFSASSGVQTETCTDANGGLDVGFADDGDYLVFKQMSLSRRAGRRRRTRGQRGIGWPSRHQDRCGRRAAGRLGDSPNHRRLANVANRQQLAVVGQRRARCVSGLRRHDQHRQRQLVPFPVGDFPNGHAYPQIHGHGRAKATRHGYSPSSAATIARRSSSSAPLAGGRPARRYQ